MAFRFNVYLPAEDTLGGDGEAVRSAFLDLVSFEPGNVLFSTSCKALVKKWGCQTKL